MRSHPRRSRSCCCSLPRVCGHKGGHLPAPKRFSREQLSAWIAEDESNMKHLRDTNGQ